MIIDRVRLHLKSGKGGDGSSAFVRQGDKSIPAGGNGGRGADIIISVNSNLYDLNKFRYTRKFSAPCGEPGKKGNKSGKQGENLFLEVPLGTLLKDEQGRVLADLNSCPREYRAVKGGQGGKGNFKRHYSEQGGQGEETDLELDFRIPNDVAFIGRANAGRTSLFNALSGQKHKVADYPYTTGSCSWAVCEYQFKRFIVLDTPPLKETAVICPQDSFLKHLFRSRIIIIVCDDFPTCVVQASEIREKLISFDPGYSQKKFFYLLNKIDRIEARPGRKDWINVSVQDGSGLDRLKDEILKGLS